MDTKTELQPLSTESAVLEIEKQVERAIESGAKLVIG
jgi:acyl-CoA reductase-like NAD-dependent aldehyde dehydrogenase